MILTVTKIWIFLFSWILSRRADIRRFQAASWPASVGLLKWVVVDRRGAGRPPLDLGEGHGGGLILSREVG